MKDLFALRLRRLRDLCGQALPKDLWGHGYMCADSSTRRGAVRLVLAGSIRR